MDTPRPETLHLDDRTDWNPRLRWRVDRRWALVVLGVFGAFAALRAALAPSPRPRASPPRPAYLVAVVSPPRADCSPSPGW